MNKMVTFIFLCFVLSGCVENLNLSPCGEECPLNQICIQRQCGCSEGTVRLAQRCFSSQDGFFIGNLGHCIGRIGFGFPDQGSVEYRFDSGKEGVYDGIENKNIVLPGEIYVLNDFTTCTIRDTSTSARITLTFGTDAAIFAKVEWYTSQQNQDKRLIEETNVEMFLPEK